MLSCILLTFGNLRASPASIIVAENWLRPCRQSKQYGRNNLVYFHSNANSSQRDFCAIFRFCTIGHQYVICNCHDQDDGNLRDKTGYAQACITNIILDPIFIFAFRWGVKGAAWATIAGQG